MPSATLETLFTTSHQIAVEAVAFYNRAPITQPLRIVGGSVTLDRTAALRGRGSVERAEPRRIPTATGGPLTPYGFEISVRRGVVHADGSIEYGPLGLFPIQTSKLDGVTLLTSLEGIDRSQLVVDARLEDDYGVTAGTNYATAIHDLVDAAGARSSTYRFTSTTFTTPQLVFQAQGDRWEAARDGQVDRLRDLLRRCRRARAACRADVRGDATMDRRRR